MKQILRNMSLVMVAMTLVFSSCEDDLDGSGSVNGHDYVDLGLPSGLKWATCNVGANSPEGYGNYYAWGETSTKSEYSGDNSLTYCRDMDDISGNVNYDAATANWGGSWRMPTEAEMRELDYQCTWTWTSQSGVPGYKVTGPNGKSIFLPAAGYCNGLLRLGVSEHGYYWSSTPMGSTEFAYGFLFGSRSHTVHCFCRGDGRLVRPVSE